MRTLHLLALVTSTALGAACATTSLPGTTEADVVLETNRAFDAALSNRSIVAIDSAWSHEGNVTAIHPASKGTTVGWVDVRKSFEGALANFPELSVVLDHPQVRVAGPVAYVVGIETIRGRRPNGEWVEFQALTTNIYEKQGDRWLMVHHQASRAPS